MDSQNPTFLLLRLFFLSVLPVPAPLLAQGLSPDELEIVRFLDEHSEEAVSLLERVVNINSGTMNHQGVREVGRIFREELDGLDFDTRWIEFPPEVNRAGHLFATHLGNRGPNVLLIGHLDTVFEPDSPFQRFQRMDSLALGPGVADMKGGDVAILYALKALQRIGALDHASIVVALTGEEESPGLPLALSRKDLVDAGRWADVALGFEGGVKEGETEYATVARRSSTDWTLEVNGTTGHSSRIFSEELGAGAVFEAARILNAFYEQVRGEEYLTFNAGVILGGTDVSYDGEATRGTAFGKTNVIPQKVVIHGGIRTISDGQLESARGRMLEIVAESLPGTSSNITFSDGYPPMAPTEANYALLERYSGVSQDLGLGPLQALDPGQRGAADISFVAPYTPALAGLGPHGSGAHSPEERVDLHSITVSAKRAAILIYRLLNEDWKGNP
ncbi:MAG: M20/M25/M40 family metallo-hydrolase [Longimicrobiales bacterium]